MQGLPFGAPFYPPLPISSSSPQQFLTNLSVLSIATSPAASSPSLVFPSSSPHGNAVFSRSSHPSTLHGFSSPKLRGSGILFNSVPPLEGYCVSTSRLYPPLCILACHLRTILNVGGRIIVEDGNPRPSSAFNVHEPRFTARIRLPANLGPQKKKDPVLFQLEWRFWELSE